MGHEDRGSWDWEEVPQPPVPKELSQLRRIGELDPRYRTRLEEVTVERDQALAAYDRMTAAAGDAQKRIGELEGRIRELEAAAKAVIDRWDTPAWKDVPATATYINALRATVDRGGEL